MRTTIKKILTIIILAVMMSCQAPTGKDSQGSKGRMSEIKTGGSRLIEIEGGHRVWTKKIGDGKIKVLLLHGGPGFSHDYLECFEDFLPEQGIEFYYYDQLGSGYSDRPTDTSLYQTGRFVEEVEQVRKGLGLKDFYLFGHSWGSMLAMEYLKKYQSHVKGAILSNMTAGIKDFTSYTAQLKKKLFSTQDIKVFDSLDRLGQYDSAAYNDLLMNKLYVNVLCRLPLEQWPEPLTRAFKKVNQSVYIQMQGVDEFHVTGNFKNWEFWNQLPRLKVPVLVLGGMYDEMNPKSMKRLGALLPNSRTYLCPEGSHMAMYDDQQNYFKSLLGFLEEVDRGTFKRDPR